MITTRSISPGRPGRGGARRDALQPARGRRTCAHARLRGADDVVQAHPPLARAPGRARTRRCPAAVEAVVERRDTRLLRAPERAPAALDCAAAVLPGLTARLHGDPTAAERGHAASWHVLLAAPQVDGHPLAPVKLGTARAPTTAAIANPSRITRESSLAGSVAWAAGNTGATVGPVAMERRRCTDSGWSLMNPHARRQGE